jgi:hypothetical protein
MKGTGTFDHGDWGSEIADPSGRSRCIAPDEVCGNTIRDLKADEKRNQIYETVILTPAL